MVKRYLAYVVLFILMAGGSAAVTVAVLPGAALPERVQTGEQVAPPTEDPNVGGNEASGPLGAIISAAEKLTAEPTEIAAEFTARMNGVTLASGNVTAKLALDMQELAASKAALSGTVTALGSATEFSAYYGDGTVYLDLLGKRVKVENARIADLFSVLSRYINLPVPDLSGLDLTQLTSLLAEMTERETEDGGTEVVLTVDPSGLIPELSAFDVTIAISADGRLESLTLPELSASGVSVSVSAAFSEGSFTLAPPEGDAADLGFLPELVDAAMNTAGLKSFCLSGEITFGGLGVRLSRALVDTVRGGFAADAVISYGETELPVSLTYLDGTLYASALGKRVKANLSKLTELLPLFGVDAAGSLPQLPAIGFEQIEEWLTALNGITYENGVLVASVNAGVIPGCSGTAALSLSIENGYLSRLTLDGLNVGENALQLALALENPGEEAEISQPDAAEYIDLDFLPEFLSAAMNTAKLKGFDLSGVVTAGDASVRLNALKLDLTDGLALSGDLSANVAGMALNAQACYADGVAYVTALGKQVRISLNTLPELLAVFGVELPEVALPAPQVQEITGYLAALKSLSFENGTLSAVLDASVLPGCAGNVTLSVELNGGYLAGLSLTGLNAGGMDIAAELTLNRPGEAVRVDAPDSAQYIDLDFLPEFLSAAMNTAKLKGFDLSGAVTAGDASVRLNALKLDLTNGLALSGDLSASVAGMALNARACYADGVAYVTALGKQVRISLNTLPELLAVFGVELPEVALPALQVQEITGYLAALKSLSFENGTLSAVLDASVLPGCAGNVTLSVELNGGYLAGLSLTGLNAGGMDIAAELTLNRPGEAVRVDVPDSAGYIDLDFLPEFLSAAMNTAKLKGFDLSGVVTAGDASVRLNALKLDLTNGLALSGDLSASVAGMALNAQACYADGVAYVTALGKQVRISLNTLPELLDLFNVAMPEVALPALQVREITGYLAALKSLSFENGTLSAVLDASVLPGCAGNVTLSVALKNGYLGGLTLSGLNAGGMDIAAELTLNRPGEAVRVDVPDSAGYIDLDFLPEFLSAAMNTAAQRSLGVTGSVSYGGLRVMLDRLDLSLAGALGVDAAVRVGGQGVGLSLNAVLADGVLYATAGGRKLSLPQDALLKTLALFGAEGVQLPQITGGEIEKYLSHLVSLDYANGVLTAVLDASVLPGCSGRMELTLVVAGGSLGGVTVRGLNVGGAEVAAELAIAEKEVNIAPPQGAYEDFSFLPELAAGVMNSLLGRTAFGLDAVVDVRGGTALTGEINYLRAVISDFALDLADGLKVAGRLDLTGALNVTGSLAYGGNRLYLNYLGLAVSMSDAKLAELAGLLVPALGSGGMGAFALPKLELTDASLAEVFSYLKSVTAQRMGGETLITVTLNGNKLNLAADLPVTLAVDGEGYLSRLELTGLVSPLDGSTVDVRVNLKRSGAAVVMPQPEDYENLDALPQIAEAVMNTAALNEFNLSAGFTVWQQGGVLKADPRLRIALDENRSVASVAGNAKVSSHLADGSVNAQGLNLDLGFWLENDWIYANANSMKLRLRLSSVGEIVNAVSRLMGGGSVDIMNTVNALVETFLSNINEVISDITVAEDGSEIVIRLNSRVLYPEVQLAEGETVDIRVGISPEKLLTSISAVNVRNGSDKFDFTILRTDTPPETQPVGDPEGYIDVSAASKLIDAFLTTAGYKYFHIKGSVGILSITRNIDLQVKVFEDGSFNFRLLMDGGSGLDWFRKYYDQNIAYYDGNYVYFQCRDLWSDGSVRNDNSYKMTLEAFLNNPIPPVKDMVDSWVLDIVPESAFTGGGEEVDYFKILNKMSIDVTESGTTVATTLNGKVLSSMLSETFTLNLRINNENQLTHIDVENLKLLGLVDVSAGLDLIDLGKNVDSVLDFAHDPSEYTLRT